MARPSPAHKSTDRLLQETDVYLMSIVLFIFLSKWGISDKTSVRRAQVDKGIIGSVKTVTSAQVPFGKAAEGFVHVLYCLFNVSRWFPYAFKGSTGRTEIFFNANPLFGFVFLWGCNAVHIRPENWQTGLAFLFPWIWIDGWIWVQVFRFFGWALALAFGWGAWWFFTNA